MTKDTQQPPEITDAQLLRNLAEDVPDMAQSIRERLIEIACLFDQGRYIGVLRCARCGERADIRISMARSNPETK